MTVTPLKIGGVAAENRNTVTPMTVSTAIDIEIFKSKIKIFTNMVIVECGTIFDLKRK